jgi:hypothetical protein
LAATVTATISSPARNHTGISALAEIELYVCNWDVVSHKSGLHLHNLVSALNFFIVSSLYTR